MIRSDGTLLRWLLNHTPEDLNDETQENGPLDAAEIQGHANTPSMGVAFAAKGWPMKTIDLLQVVLSATPSKDLNTDGLMVHMLAVQYADPKDHAYPIDKTHIHAAIDYFGKYASRYPETLRKEMAKRIMRAALRYHVEVSPDSTVAKIAAGKEHEKSGSRLPGKHEEATLHDPGHKESHGGIQSGNGPSGPTPFKELPHESPVDNQNDVGNIDLFHMIDDLERGDKQSDKMLALMGDLLGVVTPF